MQHMRAVEIGARDTAWRQALGPMFCGRGTRSLWHHPGITLASLGHDRSGIPMAGRVLREGVRATPTLSSFGGASPPEHGCSSPPGRWTSSRARVGRRGSERSPSDPQFIGSCKLGLQADTPTAAGSFHFNSWSDGQRRSLPRSQGRRQRNAAALPTSSEEAGACGKATAAAAPASSGGKATAATAPASSGGKATAAAAPASSGGLPLMQHGGGMPRAAPGLAPEAEDPGGRQPSPHMPVLLEQVRDSFRRVLLHTFVDGTVGAGGHASVILESHPELQLFVGLDVDPSALSLARDHLGRIFPHRLTFGARQESGKPIPVSAAAAGAGGGSLGPTSVHLVQDNFRNLDRVAEELGVRKGTVGGILLDVGVSSMQIDDAQRGFSFSRSGPLDMRMDPQASLTAADVVNSWPEQDLGRILRDYGEERQWRLMARRIVEARARQSIETTQQLASILTGGKTAPRRRSGSPRPGSSLQLHPATRAFQALRIAVNGELDSLGTALPRAASLLAQGGRLAVITFHSLEDRIVKHSFLRAAGKASDVLTPWEARPPEGTFEVVTAKPLVASLEEIQRNSRCRSAKLRVLERTS